MRRSQLLSSWTLAVALLVAPAALRAEEHPAPAAPASQSHAPETHKAEGGHQPAEAGHGQVHADNHAAPHGEGHATGAHHGPDIKLFGAAGGKSIGGLEQFGLKVLNFLIFAGIVVFALKGPASAAFKARAEELQAALSQAEKDKAEGEAQILALEAKMAGLQGELDGILSKADADAQAEKARIIEAARLEADSIMAQAQAEIGHHQRQAEQELRALVTQLAVEGASQRLQAAMQTGASSQVMDRAIQQVGGAK